MSEPRAGQCLRLAKLNLYQCLASAGPHYEDIYCLGQHAMIDPGQCVVDATKAPEPSAVAGRPKASYPVARSAGRAQSRSPQPRHQRRVGRRHRVVGELVRLHPGQRLVLLAPCTCPSQRRTR